MTANKLAPVYFFSHGGPSVQYETKHPAYAVLQNIGKEITHQVKPAAVVVVSAHWMGEENTILVNNKEHTDLIYDFHGFPAQYYKAKYPNRGDPKIAGEIIDLLAKAGIRAKGVNRGLDHGCWSGFTVAFDPETNPLNVPLVQVSLFHSESPSQHYALGQALLPLRSRNIVIIGAGMSVHNLRDMRTPASQIPSSGILPYVVPFDNALRDAMEKTPAERERALEMVCERGDARKAHPHMDHLMPAIVVAGAAGEDRGRRTWTMGELCMAWAQYRFGELPEASV